MKRTLHFAHAHVRKTMKKIIFTLVIMFLYSGCYQRMPSVGISAPIVHYKKICQQDKQGTVRCTTTTVWTR